MKCLEVANWSTVDLFLQIGCLLTLNSDVDACLAKTISHNIRFEELRLLSLGIIESVLLWSAI